MARLFVAGWFVFALFFLAMVVLVVMSVESWEWWNILCVAMMCFPVLVSVAMGFGFRDSLEKGRVILDRRRGKLFRGRKRFFPEDDPAAIPLKDIVALQICKKKVKTFGRLMDSYQLNLVLPEGAPQSRLNLMAHCNGKYLLEDARRLADFLGKPSLLPEADR
ncbi:MAG: hypothetical protein ACYTBJ_07700 [Planctomycetota bacterium]|jgi:hypothetical protein